MKKIIMIIGISLILTGCFAKYDNFNLSLYVNDDIECEVKEIFDLYGQGFNGICVDDAKIVKSDGTVTDLQKVFEENLVTVDDLVSVLQLKEVLSDGGTRIYEGEEYNIFRCQNIGGTNDVYITRTDVEYDPAYCQRDKTE